MNKNKKKLAFTLVELLVVIAILAVLAAVAIIGYSSFIDKAYESNDTGVITELNHYLKAANPLDEKVPTATDAARLLQGSGLNIAELKPSKDDSFYGYNYEKKEFVIVKAPLEDNANNIKIFVFVKDQETMASVGAKHYSVYLQKDFKYATENTQKELTVNYGIDVGENKDTTVINYNSSENHAVVICTNSYNTVLTVSAPNDVVNHYGKANKVDVNSVKPSSYHENGDVLGNITLKNGRVVVEEGAKANAVYVDATAEAINAGTAVVSADNSDAPEVPIILRDVVKAAADTKGGNNSIPNPAVQYVIVLSDKVTGDETKNAVATIVKADKTIINYETFDDAFNAMIDGDTLLLLTDIVLTSGLEYNRGGSVKVDLNGHLLEATLDIADVLYINNAKSFSIINGSISTSGEIDDFIYTKSNVEVFILANVDVIFESLENEPAGFICCDDGTKFVSIQSCSFQGRNSIQACNGNGEILVENCKFNYNSDEKGDYSYNNISISEGGKLTINNCECINAKYSVYVYNSGGTAIINSGTFSPIENGYCLRIANNKNSVNWQGELNYAGGSFVFTYGGTFEGKVYEIPSGKVAQLYVFGGTFDDDVSQYLVNN